MATSNASTVEKFLTQIKVAAENGTEDPGSIGGPTEHPVKDEDNSTRPPVEGERSRELSEDTKETVGPASVDAQADKAAEAGEPNSVEDEYKSIQIGTTKKPVGEDPASETASVNAGREDPGTDHPARVDNDDLDGHKYAGLDFDNMPLDKLAQVLSDIGNRVLTSMAREDQPSGYTSRSVASAGGTKTAGATDIEAELASAIGPEMAALVTGKLDKAAAESMVRETIAGLLKDASDDADRLALFIYQHKQAEGMDGGDDPSLGAPPPEAMGGGVPPEALGGGMPPEAAGGAPVPGAEGDMGGDVSPEDIAALEQVLQENGLTVDDLIESLAGDPEMMAGDPAAAGGADVAPEPPAPEPEATPAGDGEPVKEAASRVAAAEAKRAAMRDYILETALKSRRMRAAR